MRRPLSPALVLPIALLVAVATLTGHARAALKDAEIAILLNVDFSLRPARVCLVTHADASVADENGVQLDLTALSAALSEIEREPEVGERLKRLRPPRDGDRVRWSVEALLELVLNRPSGDPARWASADRQKYERETKLWKDVLAGWGKYPTGSAKRKSDTLDRLAAHLRDIPLDLPALPSAKAVCPGVEAAFCKPELELPAGHGYHDFFVCTPRDPTASSRSVVVLDIAPQRKDDAPGIKAPHLVGNAVTFTFVNLQGRDKGRDEVFTAEVLGGSYAPVKSGFSVRGSVEIDLVPRCAEHTIALPPGSTGREVQATLVVGGDPPIRCDLPLTSGSSLSMTLPNDPLGKEKVLTIASASGSPRVRSVARWQTMEPPAEIKPRALDVGFEWRRDCMYSEDWPDCPPAEIVGAGVACCGAVADDVCSYVCGQDQPQGCAPGSPPRHLDIPFDLPAHVRFHTPDGSWEEPLDYAGQELSGYLPRESRYVRIGQSGRLWPALGDKELPSFLTGRSDDDPNDLRRPGAIIESILLKDGAGIEHYVPADVRAGEAPSRPGAGKTARPSPRVALPGAQCHDRVGYTLIGEREYRFDHAEITRGRVNLRPPADLELWYGFTAGLGGGGWLRFEQNPPEDRVNYPFGTVRAGFWFRPPGWAWSFEPVFVAMVAEHSYFPFPLDTSKQVLYSYFGFDLSALRYVQAALPVKTAVGVFASVLLGAPFFSADQQFVGPPQWVFHAGLLARLYLSNRVALQLRGGVALDDDVYVYRLSGGEPRAEWRITWEPGLQLAL